MKDRKTFLCISCEFKGSDFITTLFHLGHKIYLVTSEKYFDSPWPRDHIEEIFYIPGEDGRRWKMDDLIQGTAHIFRKNHIDKIIALDDYDVWKAATLREEFRSPGMGQTTARHFFDKLAMRMVAEEKHIRVPRYCPLFNDERISEFLSVTNGPYVIKPRSDAGAIGIRKINTGDEFWQWNAEHFEIRHTYLIEEFKPGDVFHVDSLFMDYTPIFSRTSRYIHPPFQVAHGGGVFQSQTLDVKSEDSTALQEFNHRLIKSFHLNFGASHSEFIRCHEDGKYYFLETSARVGGAHLAEMVEAASGINLWSEWAKIESCMLANAEYKLPKVRNDNAGIVATLSRHGRPDYSLFDDPAIWWTMEKEYHIGLVLKNTSQKEVTDGLSYYSTLFAQEYSTTVPLKE